VIKLIPGWVIFLLCGLLAACEKNQEDISNQANQYLKSAEQLTQQGQLRAALVQAKNVIQISPDSAQGYLQIARIYNQIGYYAEVEKLLANKLVLMPELSYELAIAYYQRKKYRSALDVLAVSGVQQDQDFRLLKSLCHLQLGETDEFDMEVRKIAAVSENDGYLFFAQGKSAQINREWKQSEQLLLQISASNVLYIDALIALSEVYTEQSQFDYAEKKLTEALSITVNADTLTVEKAKILTMLVQMLVQGGRSGEAYTYQKILANANPQLDLMKSRFDEAVELYAKGDIEKAKDSLTVLHQSFPNNSNVTTLLGMIAFQQGKDEDAEAYLALVIDPETATPGLIQASSLLKVRNNKIDEAIELLKESVSAQPRNAQLLATYGLALLQKNPTDKEGAMALEKSIAMDDTQQRLRLALAERHYRLSEKEQGLAQLETAFRNLPLDNVIQKTYFNQLAVDIGPKAVVAEINQLKQKFPHEHQVTLVESWWLIKQKQYAEAEKTLLAKLSGISEKEKMASWLLLSDLYRLQGKKDSAQKVMEDYLRVAPQATPIYAAWIGLVENKTTAAIAFLQELQKLDESAWQPHFYFALLQVRSQQWDQVELSLDFVLQKTSQETIRKQVINIYNTRGFQLFQAGESHNAQKVFIKSLGIDSEDRTALYYYVQIALKSDQLAQAKKILEPVNKDKKLAIHLFLEGLISEKEQKTDAALNSFRAAWAMDAFDLYADKLYSIYQASGNQKAISDLIGEWHQRIPESPQALLLSAMLEQEQGEINDAITSYEKLLSKQPGNLVAMNNLAWLYLDTDLEKAEALAGAAVKLAPSSADVLDTYAWVLFKQDKLKQALSVADEAVRLAPDNLTIRGHLDAIQRASEH
jgi:cellulose synthase operon protein C